MCGTEECRRLYNPYDEQAFLVVDDTVGTWGHCCRSLRSEATKWLETLVYKRQELNVVNTRVCRLRDHNCKPMFPEMNWELKLRCSLTAIKCIRWL